MRAARRDDDAQACPCESGRDYAQCCEPLHRGRPACTAEALMRSRYSAYVLRLPDYLLATWHASTRPPAVEVGAAPDSIRWLGLKIVGGETTGDGRATVEFVARYRSGGGGATRLHELSRFVREDGRWYYVDGDVRAR